MSGLAEMPNESEGEHLLSSTQSHRIKSRRRWQIRLAISIPALMVLFTLAYGLISLQLFERHWAVLERVDTADVASKLLRAHLIAMIVLSVLAFITGLGLAFAILRPIQAIQETAQRIATGRLDLRSPRVSASPEIGDLSRSFNSMIEFVNESIQERNRLLIESIVSGILTVDHSGRVTALNSTGAKLLGLESASVLGRKLSYLRDHLPSLYHPLWDHLADCLRLDRPPMPDELPLGTGPGRKALLVAASVQRGEDGRASGVVINFRDSAELRNLNAQLVKTDQLAALGTLTMGMAHELRNPLGSIKGIIQLLMLGGVSESERRDYLERAVREVNRIDRFVAELLDFSNQSPARSIPAQLNDALHESAQIVPSLSESVAAKGIELVEDYDDVPLVMMESERIVRAFGNILRNAYEAAAPGSRVTLRTRVRREEDGTFVLAYVHNTGSFIPAAHQARIFDPFFTTKEKGTGLGLAIAHQIITQQEGTLDVTSGADEVAFIARFRAEVGLPAKSAIPLKASAPALPPSEVASA